MTCTTWSQKRSNNMNHYRRIQRSEASNLEQWDRPRLVVLPKEAFAHLFTKHSAKGGYHSCRLCLKWSLKSPYHPHYPRPPTSFPRIHSPFQSLWYTARLYESVHWRTGEWSWFGTEISGVAKQMSLSKSTFPIGDGEHGMEYDGIVWVPKTKSIEERSIVRFERDCSMTQPRNIDTIRISISLSKW